jgi:hypothetical protein
MANELTVVASLQATKGNLEVGRQATVRATMTGNKLAAQGQTIGTTAESLALNPDIATAGYAWLRNLDTTNYVEVGKNVSGTFHGLIKLKPGEVGMFRWADTTSVVARANIAPIVLEHWTLED